jgi:enoyl-CoA hydratase/carnithine racemase
MSAVEFETLEDNIAGVTLNRPDRLNAIDGSSINAMDDALDALSSGDFRAAILTGAGCGFCAGADLSGTGEAWTKNAPNTPAFKINYDAQVRLADLHPALRVTDTGDRRGQRRRGRWWAGIRAALRHPDRV